MRAKKKNRKCAQQNKILALGIRYMWCEECGIMKDGVLFIQKSIRETALLNEGRQINQHLRHLQIAKVQS